MGSPHEGNIIQEEDLLLLQMPTLEQQSIVHQSSIDIRTTVVSSDSVEWRALLRRGHSPPQATKARLQL